MAEPFDYQAFLKTLTRRPGVYRMLDEAGAVLYVGKARDLKARVTSYFRGQGLTSKTLAMVQRIARVETTVTRSEIEALLLEQSLIKAERPPFNVLLRDDKSYPMIALTAHSDFPRLRLFRVGEIARVERCLGPFRPPERCGKRSRCCKSSFACEAAPIATLPTEVGPVFNIRSAAVVAPAWASSTKRPIKRTFATPFCF